MASWSAIAEWKKREFWSFGFVFVFLVWLIGMLFLLFEKMKVAAECAFGFYKNGSIASTEANGCTKVNYVYLNSVGFKFLVTFLFYVFYYYQLN
jgi:hypothetical protein